MEVQAIIDSGCEVERATRLLVTAELVARACSRLMEPEVDPTVGAFSFLPANPTSGYTRDVYANNIAIAEHLRGLGHNSRAIRNGISAAHDENNEYRSFWNFPNIGFSSREKGYVTRTISVTVEKPALAREAVRRGQKGFDRQYMKAAADVIFRAAEVTPDDIATIQNNIGSWS